MIRDRSLPAWQTPGLCGKEDTLLPKACQLFLENRFSATITSNQPQRSLSSFAIIQPSSFLILHEVSLVTLAYGIHRET